MLPFRVDLNPGQSAYRQIVYAATRAVVSGELPPGSPFPSVRELSLSLKINPNTAHKVVAELVRDVRNAVPDLEVVVDECLCEGHRVVTTCTVMGTLTRPLLGCPANDKILAVAAISLWTFNSAGEIEDVSTLLDLENARLQLGLHSALGDGLSTL